MERVSLADGIEFSILVVDDNPKNLKVLQRILEPEGYKIRPATNGKLALRSISAAVPDLILLDIDMPNMNGYEVCEAIKSNKLACDIPIVFVSALDSIEDKVKAFEIGGVDYIVKPFHPEEVRSRVYTHLSLRHAQLNLEEVNAKIEQKIMRRTRQLNKTIARFEELSYRENCIAKILKLSSEETPLDEYIYDCFDVLKSSPLLQGSSLITAIMVGQSKGAGFDLAYYNQAKSEHKPIIKSIARKSQRMYDAGVDNFNTIMLVGICKESEEISIKPLTERGPLPKKIDHYGILVPIISRNVCLGFLIINLISKRRPRSDDLIFYRQISDSIGSCLARRKSEKDIEHLAFHDELTGLPNRRLLGERVEQEVKNCVRSKIYGALLYLDLDGFKLVNDAFGHEVGDEVLKITGSRLLSVLRKTDTCARWGGDEFILLLPAIGVCETSAAEKAHYVADKVCEAICQHYEIDDQDVQLSSSVGITLINGDDRGVQTLFVEADAAMYEAKRSGKNTIRFYRPEYQSNAESRLALIKGLKSSISNNELRLVYQPQIDNAGSLIGMEALMRWQHEGSGNVAPDVFIPLAEESSLIVDLGNWALLEACQQIKRWQDSRLLPSSFRRIAVNVSPKQFYENDFVSNVNSVLTETGLDPSFLEIEVTERLMLNDVENSICKLLLLKEQGVAFSIDDFGTGYSSLAYLLRLPLDMLKIDRSFISGVHLNSQAATIVSTIIGMAQNLGLSTIAEGVENVDELEYLKKNGCDFFQGYCISRPLEVADVHQAISDNNFWSRTTPSVALGSIRPR